MAKEIKNPKTILKHLFQDEFNLQKVTDMSHYSDAEIAAELEDLAKQAWQNAYIKVDYSKVTPKMFRLAAEIRATEIKLLDDE